MNSKKVAATPDEDPGSPPLASLPLLFTFSLLVSILFGFLPWMMEHLVGGAWLGLDFSSILSLALPYVWLL